MTSYPKTFDVPDVATVRIGLPAGEVRLDAVDGLRQVEVDLKPLRPGDEEAAELVAATTVQHRGADLAIDVPSGGFGRRSPALDLAVRLPAGSTVVVVTRSAGVRVAGPLGRAEVRTSSGDVRLPEVSGPLTVATASGYVDVGTATGPVRASTASGDVSVRDATGPLTVETASGDVDLAHVRAAAKVSTASGDVRVGDAELGLECRTASGDVTVRAARTGVVSVATASGDVAVGVSEGTAAWLDVSAMSGDVSSTLEPSSGPREGQATIEVRVRTMSGDVEVHRAA